MSENSTMPEDDWEARLCRALADIPQEKAPRGLRRRLRRIPRQQRALERPGVFIPRWAVAFSLLPIVLASYLYWQNNQQMQLIAQGRQDLELALTYLDEANKKASSQVLYTIESGLTRPVTNSTVQAVQQSVDISKEYEL